MRLGGMVIDTLLIDPGPLRTSRPFRFAFAARLVSLLGIGLLVVAVPAQTYALTGSSLHVAGVATAMGIGLFVGSLGGGVLVDRFERRRTIQLARSAAGLAFAVLGANALLPDPSLAVVYVASAADGLAGGVSGTALMAVIPTIVPRDKLAAAGALTALTTDLGTIASPAVAGVIIASGGIATTYFVAAVATVLTVGLVRGIGPSPAPEETHEQPLRALATGLRYAGGHRVVRAVLVVGLLTMLVSGPTVLLPAYVDQTLGAGPQVLGLLYGAPAVGALLGSLTSGWTGHVRRSGIALLASVALMSAGIAVLGVAGGAVVAFLALAGHGLGRALTDILRFAVLQQNTPDALRGRISSLWQVQVVVGTSVGSILAGLLGRWFDPDTALFVYGLGGVVLAALLVGVVGSLWRVTNDPRTIDPEVSA
ncbi:enterobactin transporter EntS [Pseudonocardia kujensis]|uniref:enterobactin transporter EntS n=1 Tax=Pseudonocardia kujensis TaxID=1128675 RepID=UPI001E33845D|nr:enterobactin transporter EntS [Pseudonocardia kujensis]MCE0766779.1 enterobactin transporter EntS [Pseudonocardia kujensis]